MAYRSCKQRVSTCTTTSGLDVTTGIEPQNFLTSAHVYDCWRRKTTSDHLLQRRRQNMIPVPLRQTTHADLCNQKTLVRNIHTWTNAHCAALLVQAYNTQSDRALAQLACSLFLRPRHRRLPVACGYVTTPPSVWVTAQTSCVVNINLAPFQSLLFIFFVPSRMDVRGLRLYTHPWRIDCSSIVIINTSSLQTGRSSQRA